MELKTKIKKEKTIQSQVGEVKTSAKDVLYMFKKNNYIKLIPWILLSIVLIISIFLAFQLSEIRKDPLKVAQAETNEIIKTVGKILVLPTGETPKIATLTESDVNRLKTQSFFLAAKVGDKVLVYSTARKVILYDPQINKIVEVANLDANTVGNPSPSSN
jgi:hypothetical protein